MKKIILALSLIMFSSGVAFALDNPSDVGEIKKVRGSDQATPTKVYKLVRYVRNGVNDVAVVSGDALVYSTVSDDGVSVNLTTTSGDNAFAGIAVTAIQSSDSLTTTSATDDIGRRNWGYIQVHGPCLAKVTAGGTNGNSAGDLFITSTDSGAITGMQGATVSGDNASTTSSNTNLTRTIRNAASSGGFFLDAGDGTTTMAEVQVEAE